MIEFIVLDVEPLDRVATSESKDVLAYIEVARVTDFGVNDVTFHVTSHLGGILSAGDTVKGYDLSTSNFGASGTYFLKQDLPEIVLVRRVFPREMVYICIYTYFNFQFHDNTILAQEP